MAQKKRGQGSLAQTLFDRKFEKTSKNDDQAVFLSPLEMPSDETSFEIVKGGSDSEATLKVVQDSDEATVAMDSRTDAEVTAATRKTDVENLGEQNSQTRELNVRSITPAYSSSQQSSNLTQILGEADLLEKAQIKIQDLESITERLRYELANITAQAKTLKVAFDESELRKEDLEGQLENAREIAQHEISLLKNNLNSKERELGRVSRELSERDEHLKSSWQKINSRSRDLEHRLEIAKRESQAVMTSKDQQILELRNKVDQLSYSLEDSQKKMVRLQKLNTERIDLVRKSARALRIALATLESEAASASENSTEPTDSE